MNTAQEILSQPDVFLAIQQKKTAKKTELNEVSQRIAKVVNTAVAPLPCATNKMELALQMARNAFNIWQGISMGMKVIRGFRSAFKK